MMHTALIARIKAQFKRLNQDQIVISFFGLSLLCHILVYGIPSLGFFQSRAPIIQEWSIETDLVSDLNLGAGNEKTVIEDAPVAEQVSVPSRLLPQLTKTYDVEDQEQEPSSDGLIPDESVKEGPVKDKQDAAEISKKESVNEEAIKLRKKEAYKRLVMEKLRQAQKEQSNKLHSEAKSELSKLSENLNGNSNSGGNLDSLKTNAESQRYQQYLNKTIRRNYSLPNSYKYRQEVNNVFIVISINGRGELISAEVEKTSGDSTLDAYCIEAIKRSEPFNIPPDHLISSKITINFSP